MLFIYFAKDTQNIEAYAGKALSFESLGLLDKSLNVLDAALDQG